MKPKTTFSPTNKRRKNLEKKVKAETLDKINMNCLISAMLLKGIASRGNRHSPSQIYYMPGGEVNVYALKLKNSPISNTSAYVHTKHGMSVPTMKENYLN